MAYVGNWRFLESEGEVLPSWCCGIGVGTCWEPGLIRDTIGVNSRGDTRLNNGVDICILAGFKGVSDFKLDLRNNKAIYGSTDPRFLDLREGDRILVWIGENWFCCGD